MDEITFNCPKCGERFAVPAEEAEWSKPCSKCGAPVPPPGSESLPPLPPRPAASKTAPLKLTTFKLPRAATPAPAPLPLPPSPPPAKTSGVSARTVVCGAVMLVLVAGALIWRFTREPKPTVAPVVVPPPAATPTPPLPAAAGWVALEVVNPGFEDGLEAWKTASKNGSVSVLSAAARTGSRGVRLLDEGAGGSSDLMGARFPAEAGRRYEVRCWARNVSGDGTGLYLRFFNAAGKGLNSDTLKNEIKLLIPKEATTWREVSVGGTAPPGTESGEIWVHTMKAAVVTTDVDDFRLRKQE